MDEAVLFYLKELNTHKKTSKLFWLIPFNFRLVKHEAVFFMFIFFVMLGFFTNTLIIAVLLFFLLSTEYSRVFDYRQKILDEALLQEEMFRIILAEEGVDPNFPYDPLYVTMDDRAQFFIEALCANRSYHIFKKISFWIKRVTSVKKS